MRDRLAFEKTEFDNGISWLHYHDDRPFGYIGVNIPFGSLHNGAFGVPLGAAHFLEHCLSHSSFPYPGINEYDQWVADIGADANAVTNTTWQTHYIAAPNQFLNEAFRRLMAGVFEPRFLEEEIAIERGAVINEREQYRYYYPAADTAGCYLVKHWMRAPDDLYQTFGTDESLHELTAEKMTEVHSRTCFVPGMFVVTTGNVNEKLVIDTIAAITTHTPDYASSSARMTWDNPMHRTETIDDIGCPTLAIGAIGNEAIDWQTQTQLHFVMSLIAGNPTASLDLFVRNEMGESYGSTQHLSFVFENQLVWQLEVPVNSIAMVELIRDSFWTIVHRVIFDDTRVNKRLFAEQNGAVFRYETLRAITNTATRMMQNHRQTFTETDIKQAIGACRDTVYLGQLVDRYLLGANLGSILLIPGET